MKINSRHFKIYKKGTTPHDQTMQQTNMYMRTGPERTKHTPFSSTPIASENLMIDEFQYLRKVAIEDHNKISPAIHTHNLNYNEIKLDINKGYVHTMNALIDPN